MFDNAGLSVFLVVVASSVWKHLALGALSSTFFARRRKRELAGHVSAITVFPLKSMKGVDVDTSDCSYTGLVGHVNGSLLKDRSVFNGCMKSNRYLKIDLCLVVVGLAYVCFKHMSVGLCCPVTTRGISFLTF